MRNAEDRPLFPKKLPMGRPAKYVFDDFLKKGVEFIVFPGLTPSHYYSLKTCFQRWRKERGLRGRWEYDILEANGDTPCCITIWRIK